MNFTSKQGISSTYRDLRQLTIKSLSKRFVLVVLSSVAFVISNTNNCQAQATGSAPATLTLPIQNATNIQWYKDGAALSGQTSSTYSATASGTYYAKYDDPSACAGRSTMTIALTALPTADLGVTVTPLTQTNNKGEIQQYLVTVTNNGPDAAPNATVRVTIPQGRTYLAAVASQGSYDGGTQIWTVGSLANGASATMTWSIKID